MDLGPKIGKISLNENNKRWELYMQMLESIITDTVFFQNDEDYMIKETVSSETDTCIEEMSIHNRPGKPDQTEKEQIYSKGR